MKKIATLLLAAGLLFSAAGMAQAIDFKIRGQWIMAFDYGLRPSRAPSPGATA